MSMEEADSSVVYTPQMVACSFVNNYYNMLSLKPEVAHQFYEDSSTITRPDLDGVMSSVSTMLGIKDKILSLGYHNSNVEIFSIDAQPSCNESVLVLVTGFLIGNGEKKTSFTQTFLLVRNEKGYFVLNDIFRFGIDEALAATVTANEVVENDVAIPITEDTQESAKVSEQQAEGKQSELVGEKVITNGSINPSHSVDERVPLKQVAVTKPASTLSAKQAQDLPKMSYALMLQKQSPVSTPAKRPTPVVVVSHSANSYLDKPKEASAAPKEKESVTQQAPAQRRNNASSGSQKVPAQRKNNVPPTIDTSRDGKSIYVGNLPPHIPAVDLDKRFSKFGPIRKDGVQVRTYEDGFSYGFVEFETLEAATEAVKEHIFWFGNYKSYATEKKSGARGSDKKDGGNAKPGSGNGEYRNSRRSRENSGTYNNSRSNSSRPNEFSNRGNGGEQNQGVKSAPPTASVK